MGVIRYLTNVDDTYTKGSLEVLRGESLRTPTTHRSALMMRIEVVKLSLFTTADICTHTVAWPIKLAIAAIRIPLSLVFRGVSPLVLASEALKHISRVIRSLIALILQPIFVFKPTWALTGYRFLRLYPGECTFQDHLALIQQRIQLAWASPVRNPLIAAVAVCALAYLGYRFMGTVEAKSINDTPSPTPNSPVPNRLPPMNLEAPSYPYPSLQICLEGAAMGTVETKSINDTPSPTPNSPVPNRSPPMDLEAPSYPYPSLQIYLGGAAISFLGLLGKLNSALTRQSANEADLEKEYPFKEPTSSQCDKLFPNSQLKKPHRRDAPQLTENPQSKEQEQEFSSHTTTKGFKTNEITRSVMEIFEGNGTLSPDTPSRHKRPRVGRDLHREIENLQAEVAVLKGYNDELHREALMIPGLRDAQAHLKTQLQELESSRTSIQDEYDKNYEELKAVIKKNRELGAKVDLLERSLENQSKTHEGEIRYLQTYQAKRVKKAVEKQTARADKLKAQLKILTSRLIKAEETAEQYEGMPAFVGSLRETNKQLRTQQTADAAKIKALTAEVQTLGEQLEASQKATVKLQEESGIARNFIETLLKHEMIGTTVKELLEIEAEESGT